MRDNPIHATEDPGVVRELVRENPWAILVSNSSTGLVASHCPVLLDDESAELAIVTHLGKPDDEIHELGSHEVLLIVQGRHGYISPSWYAPGATRAPTWNFTVAHCYGVPEVLAEDETLTLLARLVENFEQHVESPLLLDPDWGAPVARGTVGFRLPIDRFICKVKLSQDKDQQSQRNVIAALRVAGPYQNRELADRMERELFGAE